MAQSQNNATMTLQDETNAPQILNTQQDTPPTAETTVPASTKQIPPGMIQNEVNPPPPTVSAPPAARTKNPTIATVPDLKKVTPLNRLGEQPQWIDCEFCQRRTKTRVVREGTGLQVIAGVLCCLCCICLACVPCLAHWFEDTTWFCSNCNRKVAYRPYEGEIQVFNPADQVGSVASPYPKTARPSAAGNEETLVTSRYPEVAPP